MTAPMSLMMMDDDTFYCGNGEEIPMEWVNDGDNDCGDWSDEDEIDIYWESYYGGYCEWEGYPDGDDTVWWCKESQEDDCDDMVVGL